jgi:hypothetical protein
MSLTRRLIAILLSALLCAPSTLALHREGGAQANSAITPIVEDVTIVIQQQGVRFTGRPTVEAMQLQVFNQLGELVFDSGQVFAAELNWPFESGNGEPLKSGLYAYRLSIKETGMEKARERRGHFIVDRAADRDNGADRLWITSHHADIGAELTVAKDENATVAGAATSSERTTGQRREGSKRSGSGREVETETGNRSDATGAASAAAPAGTTGRIAKFTSTTEVGDSEITEVNGNIGIGTTNPTAGYKLEVNGATRLATGGTGGAIHFGTPNFETGMTIAGSSRADIRFDGSTLKLVAGPAGGPPGSGNGVAITTSGNVGIGTTNPTAGYKFEVNGAARLTPGGSGGAINFGTPNAETGMTIIGSNRADFRFDGSSLKLLAGPGNGPPGSTNGVAINTSGNVGIGTANPATKLHVEGGGIVETMIKSGNERAILALSNGLGPSNYVWTLESGVGGSFPSLFGIYNRVVNKSGLEIDGNLLVTVKALQITGGADLAENFDVRAETAATSAAPAAIQPGMVVSIDPKNPGKLTLSNRAYDRRVAGVISGAGGVEPGMMMGQKGTLADGKQPVALTGRVYVWVDATRGAVRPGDLLTTSATPGHAMKATNPAQAQGAIIGKAMTGIKAGKGLVLVLVTLQ